MRFGRTVTVDKFCKTAAVWGLAGILAFLMPIHAMAQVEKPESMDDETWTKLQDNVLEYEEIGDLVEYFNPTYQQVIQNIHINIQPYEEAATQLRGSATDMIADAKAVKDDNKMMYQMYYGYAKAYQSAAKNFEKVVKTINSSTRSTLNSTRKQLTSGIQQLMIGYHQALSSKELVDTAVELAQAAYDSTITQNGLGMATAADVQSAQTSLQSAMTQQQSLNDTLTNLRQQLMFMTGWPYDAIVEIGEIPAPDLSRIDAMNPEQDLEKAISNNYTYLSQRKASGKGDSNREAKFRTLEESEAKIKIELESLYQTVLQSKMAYEAAHVALESAELTMNGTERKYQMGMLGRLEYLQMKLAYLQQKSAAAAAALTLTQAMEGYDWALEGLADIS